MMDTLPLTTPYHHYEFHAVVTPIAADGNRLVRAVMPRGRDFRVESAETFGGLRTTSDFEVDYEFDQPADFDRAHAITVFASKLKGDLLNWFGNDIERIVRSERSERTGRLSARFILNGDMAESRLVIADEEIIRLRTHETAAFARWKRLDVIEHLCRYAVETILDPPTPIELEAR